MKTLLYTTLALIAFASNAVLCRLALKHYGMSATGFTAIRLICAVIVLYWVAKHWRATHWRAKPSTKQHTLTGEGIWLGAVLLFTYAGAFSFAYVTLDTGMGALILFAMVQLTLAVASAVRGESTQRIQWFGLVVAFAGFVYLIAPSLTAASTSARSNTIGCVLMSLAGIAWGLYTLLGTQSHSPLLSTFGHFLRTLSFVLVSVFILVLEQPISGQTASEHLASHISHVSWQGAGLAALSGAVASGAGYVIWYQALAGLSSVQAGVVQLLVPVIAAALGVLLLGEAVSQHIMIATLVIMAGILMVILNGRSRLQHRKHSTS